MAHDRMSDHKTFAEKRKQFITLDAIIDP